VAMPILDDKPGRGGGFSYGGTKKMDRKYGMASPAGIAYCNQTFHPEKAFENGTVYMPAYLENWSGGGNSIRPTGGLEELNKTLFSMTCGTSTGALVVRNSITGFKDEHDILVTGGTYAATTVPVATGATVNTQSSCPKTPFVREAIRNVSTAVCTGMRLKLYANSEASADRKGRIAIAWVDSNDGLDFGQVEQLPGAKTFDASMLTDKGMPIIVRPPRSMSINNRVAGDADIGWVNPTYGGYIIVITTGIPATTNISFKFKTKIFRFGRDINRAVYPEFSTTGFDCVLTCFSRVLGQCISFLEAKSAQTFHRLKEAAQAHQIKHTGGTLLSQVWNGVKRIGHYAVTKILPEIVPLLFA